MKVSVCITSHNRLEQLKNAIYYVKHQSYPIYDIKVYASGYEDDELSGLGVDVSYEHDYQDWGHHKRAKAYKEMAGDYFWTVADDDTYPLTFIERMTPGMKTGADIVYCDYATKTNPEYWCKASLERGHIGNGNILVSKRISQMTPYTDCTYGGDWIFIDSCLKNGATTHYIEESLHFHV